MEYPLDYYSLKFVCINLMENVHLKNAIQLMVEDKLKVLEYMNLQGTVCRETAAVHFKQDRKMISIITSNSELK